jgi:two-component system cell cycle sensor histidine kinase/response regulator CckA
VVMPRMTGSAAHLEMKKTRPDIKTVFISGYTADDVHIPRRLAEGRDFVQTPITPTALLKKVREVLDKK